jgi:hypothetical protein
MYVYNVHGASVVVNHYFVNHGLIMYSSRVCFVNTDSTEEIRFCEPVHVLHISLSAFFCYLSTVLDVGVGGGLTNREIISQKCLCVSLILR